MGLAAVLGYSLIAAGPGFVAWCFLIGNKSFLVLLALASCFIWLLTLLGIGLVLRGFLPWIASPTAFAAVLVFSVAVQEAARLGVFQLHRRMLKLLDSLARQSGESSLCFEDRHSLALAHGVGHGLAHVTFFYLCWVPMAMADGTLYLDQCPHMSFFLYNAISSLAFWLLHAASMVVALDALTFKRRKEWLAIAGLHFAAALLTLANFAHGGCLVTAPVLLCLAAMPVTQSVAICWRGAQHTHEPLRQDEH